MCRVQRYLLLVAALVFFVWQNVAIAHWLTDHGGLEAGLAHAWATLRADRMVLLIWTDMGVFSLAALVWFARDMRVRGPSRARRALWLTATLVLGCPGFLTYLALRTPAGREGVKRQAHAPSAAT